MTKTEKIIILGILILVCFFNFRPTQNPEHLLSSSDTLYLRDTIRIKSPQLTTKTLERVRYDTVFINDTVYINLPITQREYRSDDYYAVVEGYNPLLKHLEYYPKSKIITQSIVEPPPLVSHGFNIGAGFLYGLSGLDLGFYFGYGLTIKF